MLRVGLQPETHRADSLETILAKLSSTLENGERDALYVQAISAGAHRGDPRIRQLADKIEDHKLRETAREFADLAVIRAAINKKQLQQALEILRDGRLSSFHRVWAAAKISSLLRSSEPTRANELLQDAVEASTRIPAEDPQRAYALTCLADAFFKLDRSRSWDFVQEAIDAVNVTPGAKVENAKLTARLRVKNAIGIINADEPSFNLVLFFERLSLEDIDLALSTANRLNGDASSAAVSLGIARAILTRQRSQSSTARK